MRNRTLILGAAILLSLSPFLWFASRDGEAPDYGDDLSEESQDGFKELPFNQVPPLPIGAMIHYSMPFECSKAEKMCKRVTNCYKKKWTWNIPSCKKAADKCTELPIAQQDLMPFCKTCLVAWKKMTECGLEVNDCAKWRNSCYKARQRERTTLCEPDGIPLGMPIEKINDTDVSNACAASLRVEALTRHLAVLARKISDLPPPPPPGKGKKGKGAMPKLLVRPPAEPAAKPKYIDLEY